MVCTVIPPCKSLCQAFTQACGAVLKPLMPMPDCSSFPETNCESAQRFEASLPKKERKKIKDDVL